MDWETLLPEAQIEEAFTPQPDESSEEPKETTAVQLYRMAQDAGALAFRSEESGGVYIRYMTGGRFEIAPLDSEKFKSWLCLKYFRAVEREPKGSDIAGALLILKGEAWERQPKKLQIRLAKLDNKIFLDLCDEARRVVAIDADGWTVTQDCDAWFLRSAAMLPLPEPEEGGSLLQLKPFVNCSNEDLVVLIGWLVASMNPDGPFPLLAVSAQQGCGKSTVTTILKDLLDPDVSPKLGMFESADALFSTAASRWALAYDNVGRLNEDSSNALCRIATGGGHSKRQLYTDNESYNVTAKRPVILNGISLTIGRMDLLDRTYQLRLNPIEKRLLESEYYRRFNELRPKLLGALCTAVSAALREVNHIPERLPRMADAAAFVLRSEKGGGLPWEPGMFAEVMRQREDEKLEEAIADDSTAQKLVTLAACGGWTGTMRELLSLVLDSVEQEERKFMPSTPRGLGRKLEEIAPLLRSVGVRMGKRRSKTGWLVTLAENPQGER